MDHHPPRLLVVDDDPVALRILEAALNHGLFDVATAATCDAARGAVERGIADGKPFAVAAVDHFLPDGNGGDLIHDLQAIAPDLQCVLISAAPDMIEVCANCPREVCLHDLPECAKPCISKNATDAVREAVVARATIRRTIAAALERLDAANTNLAAVAAQLRGDPTR